MISNRILMHRCAGLILLAEWRDRVIEASPIPPPPADLFSDVQATYDWSQANMYLAQRISRAVVNVDVAYHAMLENYEVDQRSGQLIFKVRFTLQ